MPARTSLLLERPQPVGAHPQLEARGERAVKVDELAAAAAGGELLEAGAALARVESSAVLV